MNNDVVNFLKRTNLTSIVFGIVTIVFVYLGYDKLANYRNIEGLKSINAYVGGDAYNYIINATRATAYFILALLSVSIAIGSVIISYHRRNLSMLHHLIKAIKDQTSSNELPKEPNNT